MSISAPFEIEMVDADVPDDERQGAQLRQRMGGTNRGLRPSEEQA